MTLEEAEAVDAQWRQAGMALYHLRLRLTRVAALDKSANVDDGQGPEARRGREQRIDPDVHSRTAGRLLGTLQWDFTGDLQMKLETSERAGAQCSAAAGESLGDGNRVGMVRNRMHDDELATLLILNVDRLDTWPLLRAATIKMAQARAVTPGWYPGMKQWQQARGQATLGLSWTSAGWTDSATEAAEAVEDVARTRETAIAAEELEAVRMTNAAEPAATADSGRRPASISSGGKQTAWPRTVGLGRYISLRKRMTRCWRQWRWPTVRRVRG